MTKKIDVMHPYLRKIDIAYSDRILDDVELSKPSTKRHHRAFSIAIKLFPASDIGIVENLRIITYVVLSALM